MSDINLELQGLQPCPERRRMRVKTGGGGPEALRTGSGFTGGEGKTATGGVNSLGLTDDAGGVDDESGCGDVFMMMVVLI